MDFRKINNGVGWALFLFATSIYLMTMEPTVSFWDCGEFMSSAYKQEVGHSPGAPLFAMLQRLFALFGFGDAKAAAKMMNAFSAVMSGGTILFLFWTITHMARRLALMPARTAMNRVRGTIGGMPTVAIVDANNLEEANLQPDSRQTIAIIGAGLIGALAYTFSDTFWFSAVEAEVYACSSFFTALTFWAILKWEAIADRPYADRWLLMIMYLMGLSIGIHLLNLLTIPALAMVYYFRRYQPTVPGAIAAFVIGGVILGLVQYGVIQYVPIFAFWLDRLFVNSFGLPFFSGAITAILLVCVAIWFGLRWAKSKGHYRLHTGILMLVFVMIGFSSYVVPVIRSNADTAIDMTDPANMPNLLSYVQREQFGEQPILKGPYFTDRLTDIEDKAPAYLPAYDEKGKPYYKVVGRKPKYVFENEHFFSRIWDSNDPNHVSFYRQYLGLDEGEEPTSADNMRFFVGYQMNWMWWRYFMWNYAGRQNDFEGQGEPKNGNWISGIGLVDKARGLGDMDKMGSHYRDNAARNQLYFLPLILGILGIVYQFRRSNRQGIVVATLFFFTGIAIGIYLNMPPLQPRERDYAFAGSTYAYAIWIGLGVMMLDDIFQRYIKGSGSAIAATALSLLAVPVLMASVEWHDHDRSRKTLARASAYNTLMSCEKNAILFTFGDNDTYPLWYLQEVEGIRPDIRIVNTSLLGIGWYVDQLTYKINEADAVPMLWKRDDYIGDARTYLRLVTKKMFPGALDIPENTFIPLDEVCRFIIDPGKQLPVGDKDGEPTNYFPTRNFSVKTPSMAELQSMGWLQAGDSARYTNVMQFQFPKSTFTKDDIAILNIVAANAASGWKRPIYFGGGLGDNYQGMEDYLQLEGTVYRLMPFKQLPNPLVQRNPQEMGFVNIKKSDSLFRNLYTYGGGERTDVYFDEKNKQMFMQYRINAARIADELSAQGRKPEAIALLDKVMKGITERSYQYDHTGYFMAGAYFRAGALQQARDLTKKIEKNMVDDINWIMTLPQGRREASEREARFDMQILGALMQSSRQAGDTATAKALESQANMQVKRLQEGGVNLYDGM